MNASIVSPSQFPLSPQQVQLWLAAQLSPKNPAHIISHAVQVDGPLRINLLQVGFNAVCDHHVLPNVRINGHEEHPVIEVINNLENFIGTVDLSQFEGAAQDAELKCQMQRTAQRPITLDAGPLLRLAHFCLAETRHVLLLTAHHIIFDGGSARLFFRDLFNAYAALQARKTPKLARLGQEYGNYVQQEHERRHTTSHHSLDYWKERLSGAPSDLKMPLDRPPQKRRRSAGGVNSFILGLDYLQRLELMAQQVEAPLLSVPLAALNALIYRYTSNEDVVVGGFVSQRTAVGMEDALGLFLTNTVYRTSVNSELPFTDLLQDSAAALREAQQHPDLPLNELYELLKIRRNPGRHAFYDVAIHHILAPPLDVQVDGLQVREIEFDPGVSIYDLYIELWNQSDGLLVRLVYNSDVYDSATIVRLAGHFRTLLEAVIDEPIRRPGELLLLNTEERRQLLMGWNDTHADYPPETIHTLIAAQAGRTPDAVAVEMEGEESLTYRELEWRAAQLAHRLTHLGVAPETLVGVSMHRSPRLIIALLAVLKAGGAYLPLDPDYPPARLAYIMEDSGAALLLTDSHKPDGWKGEVLRMDDFADLSSDSTEEGELAESTWENLAYIIYTSGSTGKPKGVMIEHRSLVNYTWDAIRRCQIGSSDRVLQFASINFDASAEEIYPTLCVGGTLVLRTPQMVDSVTGFLAFCRNWGISVLDLPTALWHEIVLHLEQSSESIPPALRLVIIGGERAVPQHVFTWRRLVGEQVRLLNTYGPTETTIVVTSADLQESIDPERDQREVAIGRPVANTRAYLLDAALQPVPRGVVGELYIGGDCLGRGYLHRPELTAERFITVELLPDTPERLYRTGDLARYRPNGDLEFGGRADRQMKIRGFRIESGEVEAALLLQPGIENAVVVECRDPANNQHLAAYLTTSANQPIPSDELRTALLRNLPAYMTPTQFIWLDKMPLTPSGKIDTRALPEPEWSRSAQPQEASRPFSETEQKILVIWQEIFGREQIGLNESFFDLGGHSLMAARMLARMEKEMGASLPLATLFNQATIAALAAELERADAEAVWSSLVPIQAGNSHGTAPLFLVHQVQGDIVRYFQLAPHMPADQPIYGLRARGLDGRSEPHNTISGMAAYYIDLVRSVQPQGPYCLGGHSFGGIVAYEMAQQLSTAGEQVALVAMIDVNLDQENLPDDLQLNKRQILQNQLDKLVFVIKKALMLSWDDKRYYFGEIGREVNRRVVQLLSRLAPARSRGQTAVRLAKLLRAGEMQVGAMISEAFGVTEEGCKIAWENYQLQPYPGRLTVVLSKERERSWLVKPQRIWKALAGGGLDIYTVPGGHVKLMREPYVRNVAEKLTDSLEKAHHRG
jgi:amino acid adenylation domain-containing protein